MTIKSVERNGNQATVVVEIDKELMESGVQKAYLKARKNIQLPGFLVAVVRGAHDQTGRYKVLNFLCHIYLTVVRGTPVVVQLLIIYFVIFGSVDVSKVAAYFGGGGHVRAAGCNLNGSHEEMAQQLIDEIAKQLS